MKPRTVSIRAESNRKLKAFNLYSAILPKLKVGTRHRQTELGEDSLEFQIVTKLFLDTFGGAQNAFNGALLGGLPPVRRVRRKNNGANINGPHIHSILKLENRTVQQNFLNELKKNFEKFPDKLPSQLIKLLFHGSGKNGAETKVIYESEEGLDIRFSNKGAYGQGIYFADNSAYSHAFSAQT